ncbi:NAD(P)/FAD-dependent oxidoreductase [Candidatus Thorarchaeota archaeon]|nr:MAG: NAD(P)/FAD-dependent oxidoreductase [Candidatus Thorarchaeota archaeon]
MYDVAVIGAGPAGSTAARYMAKSGMKVCLIDKDKFPRDKPCGGGFSLNLLDEFPYLRKRTDDFLKGVAKVGVLHSPNRRIRLQGRVDMALTLRTDFDNVLLESAIENGLEPILGKRAVSIKMGKKKSEVLLRGGQTIKASVVVGSDGVSSLVARDTGLNRKWDSSKLTACRVVEVPTKYDDIIDRYSQDLHYHFFANIEGLPGYGWIFPKLDTINIGLGIVSTHAKGLPRIFESFVSYLKRENLLLKDSDISKVKGALVPTGGPLNQTHLENCLLVGDSAGMVSPLTGGGIVYAMRAARFAAKVLVKVQEKDALNTETFEKYEHLWRSDFGKDFRKQLLAQRVFTSPFTDLLFEIGRRDVHIQEMVSEGMAESSQKDIDIKFLTLRTLLVCLRAALRQ